MREDGTMGKHNADEPEETEDEKHRRDVAERNQRNLISQNDPNHPDNRGRHTEPRFDGKDDKTFG